MQKTLFVFLLKYLFNNHLKVFLPTIFFLLWFSAIKCELQSDWNLNLCRIPLPLKPHGLLVQCVLNLSFLYKEALNCTSLCSLGWLNPVLRLICQQPLQPSTRPKCCAVVSDGLYSVWYRNSSKGWSPLLWRGASSFCIFMLTETVAMLRGGGQQTFFISIFFINIEQ